MESRKSRGFLAGMQANAARFPWGLKQILRDARRNATVLCKIPAREGSTAAVTDFYATSALTTIHVVHMQSLGCMLHYTMLTLITALTSVQSGNIH